MRNELALLRDMWPAVFLGTALVAGRDAPDLAFPPSVSTEEPEVMTRALERCQFHLIVSGARGPASPGASATAL